MRCLSKECRPTGRAISETKAVKVTLEHALAHGANTPLLRLLGADGAATLTRGWLTDRRETLFAQTVRHTTRARGWRRSAPETIRVGRGRSGERSRGCGLRGKGAAEAQPPHDPMTSFIVGAHTKFGSHAPAAAGAAVDRRRRGRRGAEITVLCFLVDDGGTHLRSKGESWLDRRRGEKIRQRGGGDGRRVGGFVNAGIGKGGRD